ncbi:MAG TPA: hydantoinase/oxoprolinase family protein [Conexibacter sp.]|nr:hydantoinase/oxoprolinase family protein [Conexibacter sp.]
MSARVAVDIGGTFTDLVSLDDAGEVTVAKVSTTPSRFADGVLNALDAAEIEGVEFFAHGTTVIINALTERKGARTALITTRGFRDVLEIAKSNRPDLYNLLYTKQPPFVPRSLRVEVTERISYKGEVLTPLDADDVRRAVAEVRRQGAEAVAICFLHSYANAEHERAAARIVREEWPEVSVTASHELTNEWREYDRASTVVLDAYVKPVASHYLLELSERLGTAGVPAPALYAMRSNGGVLRFDAAARTPINLVESGPVGGVIGAAAICAAIGEQNVITLDIGGTTAKSSLVEHGAVPFTGEYHIERTPANAGYPIKVPVVDIIEIGSGGGSIAWLDAAGSLHVGPKSAGADPGPACYGRGGELPTLTDANVIAGRISPTYFLGGRVTLDVERAREAFSEIAGTLGVSVEEAALGVIRLANASMIHLLRLVSVRRGRDPREFALVAFGGGGSIHAPALARELQARCVIIPPHPGVFSAWGMLASDLRHDVVQTRFGRSADWTTEDLDGVWRELEQGLLDTFVADGHDPERVTFARAVDVRYAGQEHTVTVPVAGALDDDARAALERRFHEMHEQLYTFRLDAPLEYVNFRLTGWGAVTKVGATEQAALAGAPDRALKEERDVDFDELGRQRARVYDRARLGAGDELDGPAVVEEEAASTIVFPDQRVRVDGHGNLVITQKD